MTLTLDLRTPIFVLVAEFNPAIFQPPWVAQHLLGRREGDDMAVAEITAQNGAVHVQLTFLDGVAVNVTEGRTELWAADGKPETLERVESVLLNMLDVLPHTPLTAIGCNLVYTDSDPTDRVTDLFNTPEGLEAEGVLTTRQTGAQMQMDQQVLNFVRVLTPEDVRFSFNYHRAETDQAEYRKFVPGLIKRSIEHSSALLKSLYGYGGHEVTGFLAARPEEGEKGENDVAA